MTHYARFRQLSRCLHRRDSEWSADHRQCRDLDHGICRQGRARARRRSRRRSRASPISSGCSAGCIATSRSAMRCATSSSMAARSRSSCGSTSRRTTRAARPSFNIGNLSLEAANEGAWGQKVRVRIEKKAATDPNLAAAAARLGVAPADLFDVVVRDGNTGRIETFLNLTTKESARRADRVLKNESSLIRSTQALPAATAPAASCRRPHRRRRVDRRDQVHSGAEHGHDRSGGQRRRRRHRVQGGRRRCSRRPISSISSASCPTPGTATCPTMCIRTR